MPSDYYTPAQGRDPTGLGCAKGVCEGWGATSGRAGGEDRPCSVDVRLRKRCVVWFEPTPKDVDGLVAGGARRRRARRDPSHLGAIGLCEKVGRDLRARRR